MATTSMPNGDLALVVTTSVLKQTLGQRLIRLINSDLIKRCTGRPTAARGCRTIELHGHG